MGCALSRGRDRRPTSRARSRCAPAARSASAGVDRQPLLLVGAADDRDGRAARDRGRGRGLSSPAASSRSPACRTSPTSHMIREAWLAEHKPELYWTMLQTAETVAQALRHPAREAGRVRRAEPAARGRRARRPGKFDDEIVPMTVTHGRGRQGLRAHLYTKEVTLAADEGIRADTTYEGVAKIRPALPGRRHRGRQREPVLRRRLGVRGDERRAPQQRRARSRSASSAASPSPAASPTRWASARCSRCRSCSRAPA